LPVATVSVLDRLGLLSPRQRALPGSCRQPPIVNARDSTVGNLGPLFSLRRA
jgi:hypothetical protein